MSLWFYVPASLALLVKLVIISKRSKIQISPILARPFWLLLLCLGVLNVMEILAYVNASLGNHFSYLVLYVLRGYYVFLSLAFAMLFEISVILAMDQKKTWKGLWGFRLICAAIVIFISVSESVVISAEFIGYTFSRVPGPYYFVAPAYLFTMLLLSMITCCFGYIVAKTHYAKVQCTFVILSVFSMAIPIVLVIILMAYEVKISAALILPIASTLFLIVLTYALNTRGIYNIRVWIPGSKMCSLFFSWHKEFVIYPDWMMSAKERRQRNEKRFLIEALMRADGNQGKAAKNLNVSPSSMSIKRKFYGI